MHPRFIALIALVLFLVTVDQTRAQGEAASSIFTLPVDAAAHALGRR